MLKLCTLNYLTSKIKLSLLSRSLSIVTNQTFIQPTKRSISTPQKLNFIINLISSRHVPLSFSQNLNGLSFLPVRKFSSTKVVGSSKTPNKKKYDRQIVILNMSLLAVITIFLSLTSIMEYHNDNVIIEPEKK